ATTSTSRAATTTARSAATTAASAGPRTPMPSPRPCTGAGNTRAPRAELRNWFYGFTPPERGAIVLGHRRVYIVPSRLGLLFGGALLILLVGSLYSPPALR